jgi:malate synthase
MTEHVQVGGLQVAKVLFDFVNNEAIPGTGITADQFWAGADKVIHDLAPKNKALLAKRDDFQARIDTWHQTHAGQAHDPVAYKAFLQDIGYLLPEAADFQASTQNVDDEIARMAGPQLVVPVMNARFALNASNARWGSLYDALYGTDAISEADGAEKGQGYNKVRGDKVIAFARAFLDEAAPLSAGSHVDSTGYKIVDGKLVVSLKGGSNSGLRDDAQLIGFQGDSAQPIAILLKHNGLHFEIQIDASTPVGQTDAAGVKDVLMEAALTTIMDCEDSVAAVDADDKVVIYRNWLGLMKGDLAEEVAKGGKTFTRTMNADRVYTGVNGQDVTLHGRSLLFVRNVGHLMTIDAILDKNGNEVPEGILDGLLTSLAAIHSLNGNSSRKNSRTGSVYIVKPKMHGPEEVGVHQRAVRPHRGRAEPAAQHPQGRASWTRSAAPRSTSRPASRPPASAWCLSTPASSTAPAMKSTPPWKPAPDGAQGAMKTERLDRRLREATGTSISASLPACKAVRRSAKACGPCPT